MTLIFTFTDNENVVIGHVDCTAGDNAHRALCDSNGVNGFPTLNIYKNGEKVKVLWKIFSPYDIITPRLMNITVRGILLTCTSLLKSNSLPRRRKRLRMSCNSAVDLATLLSFIVHHGFVYVLHFIMINCDIIYNKVFSKQLVKYTNCKEHLSIFVADRSPISVELETT